MLGASPGLLLPNRPRLVIPRGTPEINRAMPGWQQLRAAYFMGHRPRGVPAGYGPLTVKTGSPSPAVGRPGAFTSYTATSGHVATSGPSGDFSVVALAMRSITAGSAGLASNVQIVASTVNIGATRNGFILALGNSYSANAARLNAEQYNAGVQSFPSAVWVNGGKETVTSGIGTSNLSNGVWYGVGSTFTGVAVGNGALTIADTVDNFFALTGSIAVLLIYQGILPDRVMSLYTANPVAPFIWASDLQFARTFVDLFVPETLVTLTGVALTTSAGTLTPQLQATLSGTASTSAAGSTSAALAVTATGQAVTISAGSLGYSIAFTLTGEAATSASGTLTGDASDYDRTLTGIQMTALPGNVRVTGGTRWYPQAPRAETPGSVLANTLPPPPRATGNAETDLRALTQWVNTLYDQWVKGLNIMGTVQDHETRLNNLEGRE